MSNGLSTSAATSSSSWSSKKMRADSSLRRSSTSRPCYGWKKGRARATRTNSDASLYKDSVRSTPSQMLKARAETTSRSRYC